MKRRLRPEQVAERRHAAHIAREITAMRDGRVTFSRDEVMARRRSWPALRWPTGRSQRKREE